MLAGAFDEPGSVWAPTASEVVQAQRDSDKMNLKTAAQDSELNGRVQATSMAAARVPTADRESVLVKLPERKPPKRLMALRDTLREAKEQRRNQQAGETMGNALDVSPVSPDTEEDAEAEAAPVGRLDSARSAESRKRHEHVGWSWSLRRGSGSTTSTPTAAAVENAAVPGTPPATPSSAPADQTAVAAAAADSAPTTVSPGRGDHLASWVSRPSQVIKSSQALFKRNDADRQPFGNESPISARQQVVEAPVDKDSEQSMPSSLSQDVEAAKAEEKAPAAAAERPSKPRRKGLARLFGCFG
eukprot:ctg_1139.g400